MAGPEIDIIVPVRGAGGAFRRCASSLIRHVDPARHRIVIVLDGPPDIETTRAVEGLRQSGVDLEILEHAGALGFVASVNHGLGVSARDVVLLNSDTQVTLDWLDKLSAAAYADRATATVTPFSNNATICSLPSFLAENTLPAGHDLDSFAALVNQVAAREYPRIATGVGACLYIRRSVLADVGSFSEAFGLGYGEEIDFCLRASARGYHHVLDDATFIFHEGSRSFGTSRQRRVRKAEDLIQTKHPGFRKLVHEFITRDPLKNVRSRVITALRPPLTTGAPRRSDRVLHVVHGWPPWAHGGTELYAFWLAHQQARDRDVAVYARFTDADRMLGDAVEHFDQGVRVRLVVNNFTQRNPLCRNGFHCSAIARDFGAYVDDVKPSVLHVHHLAGHCASLLSVARKRGIPIVYQAQDWWPVCARMNLYDRDHALCSGPGPIKCAHCLPLTSLAPAAVTNPLLHRARKAWIRAQLAHVDAVVMGSEFIAQSYRHWHVFPARVPVHVVPYGVPVAEAANRINPEGRVRPPRFGYVGALLPHKGVHVLIEAFRDVNVQQAELHVWGTSNDAAYRDELVSRAAGSPHIHFHGAFPESGKTAILKSMDVLIVPSTGLESFGLVAREAMAVGVPVLASRLGALTETGGDEGGGAFFAPGNPVDLLGHIRRVIDEPALLDRWRHALPPVKSTVEHTREIDEIYQSLKRRSRR